MSTSVHDLQPPTTPAAALPAPALLFCPGDRPERFEKALAAADGVILDLEDAVAPDVKDRARASVVDALERLDVGRVVVRINPRGSAWYADDVAALAGHPGVTLMVPKAERRADLEDLAPHPVLGLCETAAGVLAAPDVARAANAVGLMWGSEDLVADLAARPGRDADGRYRPAVEFARSTVLYAARAAGLAPVDTVLVDLTDTALLRADSEAAASSGFAAKACVHPRQAEVVRAAFAPTEAEATWARDVLAAAADAGGGVFRFAGRMVDAPVLAHARELLRRAPGTGERS